MSIIEHGAVDNRYVSIIGRLRFMKCKSLINKAVINRACSSMQAFNNLSYPFNIERPMSINEEQ